MSGIDAKHSSHIGNSDSAIADQADDSTSISTDFDGHTVQNHQTGRLGGSQNSAQSLVSGGESSPEDFVYAKGANNRQNQAMNAALSEGSQDQFDLGDEVEIDALTDNSLDCEAEFSFSNSEESMSLNERGVEWGSRSSNGQSMHSRQSETTSQNFDSIQNGTEAEWVADESNLSGQSVSSAGGQSEQSVNTMATGVSYSWRSSEEQNKHAAMPETYLDNDSIQDGYAWDGQSQMALSNQITPSEGVPRSEQSDETLITNISTPWRQDGQNLNSDGPEHVQQYEMAGVSPHAVNADAKLERAAKDMVDSLRFFKMEGDASFLFDDFLQFLEAANDENAEFSDEIFNGLLKACCDEIVHGENKALAQFDFTGAMNTLLTDTKSDVRLTEDIRNRAVTMFNRLSGAAENIDENKAKNMGYEFDVNPEDHIGQKYDPAVTADTYDGLEGGYRYLGDQYDPATGYRPSGPDGDKIQAPDPEHAFTFSNLSTEDNGSEVSPFFASDDTDSLGDDIPEVPDGPKNEHLNLDDLSKDEFFKQ